jgi:hypothetical protein
MESIANSTGSVATVTAENLPVITWEGAKLITTDLLARLYGTQPKNIQDNYQYNAERFVKGKHFYKLEGSNLREFKNRPGISGSVGKQARSLTLWTERGAARHAKMLETDAAWEVFEKLEDCYFAVKEVFEVKSYGTNLTDTLTLEQANVLRDTLTHAVKELPQEKQAKAMIQGWAKLKSHFGVTYRQIPQSEFTEAISIIGRHIAEWEILPDERSKIVMEKTDSQVNALMGTCSLMLLGAERWPALDKALREIGSPFATQFCDIFSDGASFAKSTIRNFAHEMAAVDARKPEEWRRPHTPGAKFLKAYLAQ